MSPENLLVPVLRYLVEDLTKDEFDVAVKEGHIEFLARAFDLKPGELIDAARASRAEKNVVHGFQEEVLKSQRKWKERTSG